MASSPHPLSTRSTLASSFSAILTSTLVALRNKLASMCIQVTAWTSLPLLRCIGLYILIAATAMASSSSTAPGQSGTALARSLLRLRLLTLSLRLLLRLLLAERILLVRTTAATGPTTSSDWQSG